MVEVTVKVAGKVVGVVEIVNVADLEAGGCEYIVAYKTFNVFFKGDSHRTATSVKHCSADGIEKLIVKVFEKLGV